MNKSFNIAILSALGLADCIIVENPIGTGTEASSGSSTGDPTSTSGQPVTSGAVDESSGGSSTGAPEDALIERIFEGIGGQDNLNALTGVQEQVTAERLIVDERFEPGGASSSASEFIATVSIDFEAVNIRNDITRTITAFPLPEPLEATEIALSESGGYVAGVEHVFGIPTETMLPDRLASTIKLAQLLNPHFWLKDLSLDPSLATATGSADFEGQTYDRLEIADPIHPITLWIDQDSNLIQRLTTMENSHLRRDILLSVVYDEWTATESGVLFPNRIQISTGQEVVHREFRSMVQSNPEFEDTVFMLPPEAMPETDVAEYERGLRNHNHNQSFVSLGLPVDGLQNEIVANEITPGVFHLTGGSHHSMVIQQDNGVVVFDAPLNAQRCESILEWIDLNLMGAPVTHIVVSHHHRDHAACARTFVATGATLVVHERAQTFFEDVLAAPSTIEPDRLALEPVDAAVIEVVPIQGSFVIEDTTNPVEVFELPTTHASDMVMPFISSIGIPFVVDVYTPEGLTPNPEGAAEVLDALDFHQIRGFVGSIVGGHGGIVPIEALEARVP